jgi:hypothetical protein
MPRSLSAWGHHSVLQLLLEVVSTGDHVKITIVVDD